ncbi:32736_t:CDS:2, partial [Racocetra persica]
MYHLIEIPTVQFETCIYEFTPLINCYRQNQEHSKTRNGARMYHDRYAKGPLRI